MPKLDAIANLLLPKPEVFVTDSFSAHQSITDITQIEGTDNTLAVIIPPWHANQHIQNRLIKRQQQAGHSVLAYSLHDDILSPYPQQTIDSFAYIGQHVAADVHAYRQETSMSNIQYLAASLGCAVLMYAMGEHGIEGRVDLVVPGGNLAEGLWHGIRTQHLRQAYSKKVLMKHS